VSLVATVYPHLDGLAPLVLESLLHDPPWADQSAIAISKEAGS
jgi:hypothetical protein